MAAYCRVDDLVTCGLATCTPDQLQDQLSVTNQYGRIFIFLVHAIDKRSADSCNAIYQSRDKKTLIKS